MTFTLETLAKSLAGYLAPHFPGVTFYEDPNQQGSAPPMFFLQTRYGNVDKLLDGRYLRTLGLDLTYLLDYNLPDMQQQYQRAGETLDLLMDTFPYSDGTGNALLRAYAREWRVDLDALHYRFEVRTVVLIPEDSAKMELIDNIGGVVVAR